MELILSLGMLVMLLPTTWYFFRWIFSAPDRTRGFRRRFFASFALLLGFVAGAGYLSEQRHMQLAAAAGFESTREYREAMKVDIGDGEAWRKYKADVLAAEQAEKEKLASEAAARAEREAAQAVADAQEAAERRKIEEEAARVAAAAERQQCLKDLKCSWDAASIDLAVECKLAIQSLAKWDYEWTNGWTEPAFSPAGWQDEEKGVLMAIGKSLKLQNGFGAWKHVAYLCAYDPVAKRVVDASVF